MPGINSQQLDLELELELEPGAVVRLGILETRDAAGSAADQQITEQTAQQITGQTAGQITEQTAKQITGQITEPIAGQTAGPITGQTAGQITEQMAGQTAGQITEQTVVELSRNHHDGSGAADHGTLRLNRSRSSARGEGGPDATVDTTPKEGPAPMPNGRVSLRVLVDRSAVEIFANGKPLTARVYPRLGGGGISLQAEGAARVHRFDAWTMGEIFGGERILYP